MKIEIRNNSLHIEGYVNAVERDSRILPSSRGKFVEQIKANTWQRALEKAKNVDLLFNHTEHRKLGSTNEGNLKLHEDSIGLKAECDINDPEIIEKAKNNELRGWSFGFINTKDTWENTDKGYERRYIEDMELLEVSILDCTPAYIGTSIEARGEDTVIKELRNVDDEVEMINMDDSTEKETRQAIDYSKTELEIEILKLKNLN